LIKFVITLMSLVIVTGTLIETPHHVDEVILPENTICTDNS